MQGMLPDHVEEVCRTIRHALSVARTKQRPARGAWLKQRILTIWPDFDEKRLGYDSFQEFLRTLGAFDLHHDGTDIVVKGEVPAGRQAEFAARLRVHPERFNRSDEFIEPALWKAFTLNRSGNAYIDKRSLAAGSVRIEYEGSPNSRIDGSDNYILIPHNDEETQTRWLIEWANAKLATRRAKELERLALNGLGNAISSMTATESAAWRSERFGRSKERLRSWTTESGLRWGPPLVRPIGRVDYPRSGSQRQSSRNVRSILNMILARLSDDDIRRIWLPLGTMLDVVQQRDSGEP